MWCREQYRCSVRDGDEEGVGAGCEHAHNVRGDHCLGENDDDYHGW